MKEFTGINLFCCLVFAAFCLVYTACAEPAEPEPASSSIKIDMRVDAAGGETKGVYEIPVNTSSAIEISGLNSNRVALIHLNQSGKTITENYTGLVDSWRLNPASSPSEQAGRLNNTVSGGSISHPVREDYRPAREFIPPSGEVPGRARRAAVRSVGSTPDVTTRKFWVLRKTGSQWYEIDTTLRFADPSGYCYVWVADANYNNSSTDNDDNKITSAQVLELAQKFNSIYDKETSIFGYEPGGGPGGSGGMDGIVPVQILIYDIDEDFSSTQSGGVLGYFWSKDLYTQESLDAMIGGVYKSNYAEMFYIDAHFTDRYPTMAYSTLVHEFQHMINFNQKTLLYTGGERHTSAWYDEMLSMLAEDVLGEFIGVPITDEGHPKPSRMPLFLSSYNLSGVDEWLSGSSALISYSTSYAFGAFLARNFGGAALIKEIMSNNEIDKLSISSAVNTLSSGGWTFDTLMQKYNQAVVFNAANDGHYSFNKTVSSVVNGSTYTFQGFDINEVRQRNIQGEWLTGKGILYYAPSSVVSIKNNAFAVISHSDWSNVSGTMDLILKKPRDSTHLYLIIK